MRTIYVWLSALMHTLLSQMVTNKAGTEQTFTCIIICYRENFTQKSGTDFLLWSSLRDPTKLSYFMINNCGIQFESTLFNQPVITRDEIICTASANQTGQQKILDRFKLGTLSVKGDRSVIGITIQFSENVPHTNVEVSMDVLFILPKNVVDAIFKVYYDQSSGYFFMSDCGFFTSNESNKAQFCSNLDRDTVVRILQINTSFEHPCNNLDLIVEFVVKWSEDDQNESQRRLNQPYFFVTNLKVRSFNQSNYNPVKLKYFGDKLQQLNFTQQSQSPFGCQQSFPSIPLDFNLFSTLGVTEIILDKSYLQLATIFKRKCCDCSPGYIKSSQSECLSEMITIIPSVSDVQESIPYYTEGNQSFITKPSNPLDDIVNFKKTKNTQSYTFTYNIYCSKSEFKTNFIQNTTKSYSVKSNQSKEDLESQGYILEEDCTETDQQTCFYKDKLMYNFDVQYIDALVNNNFEQIFSYTVQQERGNQVLIYNNGLVKNITYELIFYGDQEMDNQCQFKIDRSMEIKAIVQEVVPSVESQTIIFRSAQDRGLKFTILGQIRIIGFRNVTFQNIKLDIQSKEQQNKVVAMLIKPMSLEATFILENISVINSDQMRVMQLKFILDEFQGSLFISNLNFNKLQWLESHNFIEFSQSNRFLDKLFEALSYKLDREEFYNLNINNVTIKRCRFDTTINIFTLPTTNVRGLVENVKLIENTFTQSSTIFTSFASLEPTQVESSVMWRSILIKDISIMKCIFTDNSRIFSISLQKVIPSKRKFMYFQIKGIQILNSNFTDFSSFFFNDHSYYDIVLSNVLFKSCVFNGSSSMVDDKSDKVADQERNTTIDGLVLDGVLYEQSSLLFTLQNKNFIINNVTYRDTTYYSAYTKGTLISISNFKTNVYIRGLSISGMYLHDSLINIDDQVSSNPNRVNEFQIKDCVFQNIKFNSQSDGQTSGATININSIRQDLKIDFYGSKFININYISSIFNPQLSPSIVINAFYAYVSLKFSSIIDNDGSNTQGGLNILGAGVLSIDNCYFKNNSYGSVKFKGSGGHIFAFAKNVTILNSNFSQSNASNGGAIHIEHYIKEEISIVIVQRCSITHSIARSSSNVGDGGAVLISFNVDQSSESKATKAIINILSNKFEDNLAEAGGGAIQIIPNVLTNITLNVMDCIFIDNYGLKALSIDITHNNNMQVNQGKVIWDVIIQNSIFRQIQPQKTVAEKLNIYIANNEGRQSDLVSYSEIITHIHFSSTRKIQNQILVEQVQFEGLTYSSSFILEVINQVIFQNVSIVRGYGNYTAVIYLYDSNEVKMNNFQLFNYKRPVEELLSKNLKLSGINILRSALIIVQNTQYFEIIKSQIENNDCQSCVRGILALLYVQNSRVQETKFSGNIAHQGGSLTIEYYTTVIQVFTMTQGLTSVKYILQTNNQSKTTIVNCIFFNNTSQFPGAAIYTAVSPDIDTQLWIQSTTLQNIQRIKPKNQIWIIGNDTKLEFYLEQIQQSLNQTKLYKNGTIVQGCLSGYYYNSDDHMCVECENQTYTLLTNQFFCNSCPVDKAVRCYKNLIKLKPGFWRENLETDQIFSCTYADLCVGSTNDEDANVCLIGHSGALCMSCDLEAAYWNKSYSKSSDRVCIACDLQAFQVLRTLIILGVVFIGMTIAVNSTVRNITLEMCIKYLRHMNLFVGSRYRDALFAAVYLKILATHFIVVTLVVNMDLPIPSAFVGLVSGVGSPLDQMMLSQDCFLTGIQLPLPSLYFRVFMSLLYPFGFYMIFVVAKFLQSGFSDAPIQRGTFTIGGLFVVVYMQPNLFQIIMGIISCTEEMGEKSYVTTNTNYQCYDEQYYLYFYYFSLPLLLLTTFFVPLGLLLCIFLNRNTFDTCRTRFRFGYLTLGYDDGQKKKIAKFWEIVVIYKKIATLALLNYFQGSSYNQGLLMLFTLLVYFMILKAFNPFKSEILNNTDESITLLQCYIMIIALILDINRSSEAVIYIGLIILSWVNAYAIYFLFIGIFEDFKQDFNSFMSKYYYGQRCQYMFPCFAHWFKQRKVSTNRVQHLWKTAYMQIISWRKKYIELSEDKNEQTSLEAAFNIAAVHNIDHKQIMSEYLQEHTNTTAPHESLGVNMKQVSSDSCITSIPYSQLNAQSQMEINLDTPNQINEYVEMIEPHQFSFTQDALGQVNHNIGIYYDDDGSDQSTDKVANYACYMGTVFQGETYMQTNILIDSMPKLTLLKIERNINMDDIEPRTFCFIKQSPVTNQIRLDNHLIVNGSRIFSVDIPNVEVKFIHPIQLSPFLIGYPKKKPLSSVYKRVKQNIEHNSRSKVKLMKLTSRKFYVDQSKFVAYINQIPSQVHQQLSLRQAIQQLNSFGLDLSYTMNHLHRYTVNLECTNKDDNLSVCITLRHTGGPALFSNHLKDQKKIFIDPLERFLEKNN